MKSRRKHNIAKPQTGGNTVKEIKAVAFVLLMLFCLYSCKDNWLDVKPQKFLVTLSTIPDLQALLDNSTIMNGDQNGVTPNMGEIGCDDFYLEFSAWQTLTVIDRNSYVWAKDIFQGNTSNDWNKGYQVVYYANTALEAIEKIERNSTNQADWDNIKGSALFFRAYALYNIAQVFAQPYNAASTNSDLGIPVRMTADLTVRTPRSTIKQTYDQIINDLTTAEDLLPQTPIYKTRPSKAAVEALLSRIYLSIGDIDNAFAHSNTTLSMASTLMNYNTLSTTASYPMPRFNEEVIFQSVINSSSIFSSRNKVDTLLYGSYDTNDLRKILFFKNNADGTKSFKGSYNMGTLMFSGLAADEMYLVRAECYARKNDVTAAMADLNQLLKNRYKTGTFTAIAAIDAKDALAKIINERRKELLFRGTRWIDLRRLNTDSNLQVTLTRNLNGTVYTLPPNHLRYTLPIPDDVIAASPFIQQNPR